MRLLIAVPSYRVASVRAAAPAGCAAVTVTRLADCYAAIRAHAIDVAVIDPLLTPPLDERSLLNTVRDHPAVQWLVYTNLRPDTARLLLELGRAGVRQAAFVGIDDSPPRMHSILRTLSHGSIVHHAVLRIRASLAPLPARVRAAVEQMIENGEDVPDVTELAARACMTRRTLERHFQRASLPSPRQVLLAVRAVAAYGLLYDGTRSASAVARCLGYGKPSTLRAHVKRMFGVSPRALRGAPKPEIAVSALLCPTSGLADAPPTDPDDATRVASGHRAVASAVSRHHSSTGSC